MNYKIIAETGSEPVGVDEAIIDLKIDEDLLTLPEYSMLERFVMATRKVCEQRRGEAFLTKTIEAVSRCWPDEEMKLPIAPLVSVESIKYYGTDDTEYTLDATTYDVDTYDPEGRVVMKYGYYWPTTTLRTVNPIIINFTAGYIDLPDNFQQAILLLVGYLWRNRESTTDKMAISDMLTRVNDWVVNKLLDIDRSNIL
jgi:uncharacterized phiE125 gp8 family phage protein